MDERACVAGDLRLASGQRVEGIGIPQLDGDDDVDSPTGEPERAVGFFVADLQGEKQLECSRQGGRGGWVAVRQPQRERVEQDVDRTRRLRRGRRGARGLGGFQDAAGDLEVVGHRGPERLQVCLAGQAGVERLETSGRAHEQPAGVAAASLLQRDLSAQEVDAGSLELVERSSLNCHQQAERVVKRAGVALCRGSDEQALGTMSGFGRQHRGALEERGRRREPSACPCPASRALELRRNVLVGAGRGLGPVPRAAIGIDLRIGHGRQRPM